MIARSEARALGILAEFETAEDLLRAAKRLRGAAAEMEAFTPFPIEGLDAALGRRKSRVPFAMFCGAVAGALTGYGMQYFAMAVHYPLNVGGRPLHSWPAFVPVTFELTILFAALAGFFGWLLSSRLPKPYHPIRGAARYLSAAQDGFFLLAYADDAARRETIRKQLLELKPSSVSEARA